MKTCVMAGARALLCAVLLAVSTPACVRAAQPDPIKAVTYMGHEWVMNFWSSETEYMDEDFTQIAADGFNTIILCVPWREFQPYVSATYSNDYAYLKLREVMEAAKAHGLSVMLRLGYTWDFYDNSDVIDRFQKLLYDENHKFAWRAYAKEVYDTVSKYDNFAGAFLTWEDFWNFISVEKTLVGTATGKKLAKEMGYTDYVLQNYSYEERLLLYGNEAAANAAEFPSEESPAYKFFFDWYDHCLNELLSETQEVFPNISMECRLDQDPYPLPDGSKAGYYHGATFPCGSASFCSVMLSASMGFPEGTALAAGDTAGMSAALLAQSRASAGKPVFVDQFLYMETTPGYEHLPQFPESEVNTYLAAMGDVFRNNTIGYGIWTYRDYMDSIIYNSEFGRKLAGWDPLGTVSVTAYDGTKMAKLSAGASISQDLSYRAYIGPENTKLSFRAVAKRPVNLTITVGGETQNVSVNGDSTETVEFSSQVSEHIKIYADGEVFLDNIKLYTHITEGNIYEPDGTAGVHLAGIRELNRRLG